MPDEPSAGGAGTGGTPAEHTAPGPPGPQQTGEHRPAEPSWPPQWPYGAAQPTEQGQAPWGAGPHPQQPYGQPPYGQGQPPYGQPPYGQTQPPYGQGQPPYGQSQPPYGQSQPPYGHSPYGPGQPPYGQPGQAPYGQTQPPYGQPPYGAYGAQPGGYGYGAPGQEPFRSHSYNWPYVPPRPKATPEERRRRNRRLGGFLAVFAVFLGVGILIGSLIAPTNPTTVADGLVSKTIGAATQAGTYHYQSLSTLAGIEDNIVGDAGPDGGQQVISERCRTGTNVFDLRLVKGVVYFRGNGPAVVDQLGVAKTSAQAEVDKWVKVTKGQPKYSTFSVGITTTSNISQLKTTFLPIKSSTDSRTSPPTTRVSGALRLSKKTAGGTADLLITTATSLPRSLKGADQGSSGSYTVTWTFNHFHEKLNVTAPPNAVSYSSLHATPPTAATCA